MEDYTYHFSPQGAAVLGAHMLEICPSIAQEKPRLDIFPLGIGGKSDPVRLLFEASEGFAVNTTLLDMGNRFRLLANSLQTIPLPEPKPKLPVARALWIPPTQPQDSGNCLALGRWGTPLLALARMSLWSSSKILQEWQASSLSALTEIPGLDTFEDRLRWNELYYKQLD